MKTQDKTITRKVAEAESRDVGRGFARLDPETITELGLRVGETVLIEGHSSTPCRVMPRKKSNAGRASCSSTVSHATTRRPGSTNRSRSRQPSAHPLKH
ncbi:MAG: hypothetical protein AAGI17_00765 [Planctomycetota bacterium]